MAKKTLSARSANAIDEIIAERLLKRRNELGLSQQELASMAGVTFQQIQKYEKAANRVAASRLLVLSQALGVPFDYFFDLPGQSKRKKDGAKKPAVKATRAPRILISSRT